MQRPGGEHHVRLGHTGERGDGGASGVENRLGRFSRDVSADLGLVSRVPGGGIEHGEALPRTGGAVQVQPGDRRPGVPPGFGEACAHLTESDNPKSPAESVHHRVRHSPA